MRKIGFLIHLLLMTIFLNGCFLLNVFDFGPKINLAKNQWKIASFTLGGSHYEPLEYDEIPSMRFDTAELKLYGNTGCNSFFASYVWVGDDKIEMRNSGMTRKMCHSQVAMQFELKLMEEFDGEFKVTKEGDNLKLEKENLMINLFPLEQ